MTILRFLSFPHRLLSFPRKRESKVLSIKNGNSRTIKSDPVRDRRTIPCIFSIFGRSYLIAMNAFSYITNAENAVVEDLYSKYKNDPSSIDFGWRMFFEGLDFSQLSLKKQESKAEYPEKFNKELNVINLMGAYRQKGHLIAKTNPLEEREKKENLFELDKFGLDETDLDKKFQTGARIGLGPVSLREIINHFEQTYCGSIGVEYKFIDDLEAVEWLQHRMESCRNTPDFTIEEKKHILHKINQAVVFENFLHTKFVGQKRFSLEGAEAIIPALDAIVEKGAEAGIEEFVMGMAHRGRLNVLANILNKTYESIFTEFEGKGYADAVFEGDVKYHMGYSSNKTTGNGKKVHLSLTPNPSHLEAVNPVVQGIVRAKINHRYGGDFNKITPILIHGDASIAGQGIVYEVSQMSMLKGYLTGGTVHVVLNNQIGFTTDCKDARSSAYCTDIAKVTVSPVFHVNGDDAEAVVYVVKLAMEFRQKFHRDVFIDIVCYRKHGHNEADEPRFTQPLLYKIIAQHPNPREIYKQKLIEAGSVEADLARQMEQEFKLMLQERFDEAKEKETARVHSFLEGAWKGFRLALEKDFQISPKTGVKIQDLTAIADKITDLPSNLKFFTKIKKLFENRKKMVFKTKKLDWAMGELLAYGTLLSEGVPVRISGQDVERGTFSHRHAVIKLEDSEEKYTPLQHINNNQAEFSIYNSLLSEYGVLGFEFGYAMAFPRGLTIWEAQFGDFANGAQIIIDQFLSCSETKWQRMNGLVLFLPHGYEGQGPEHSSARLERFLGLCSDNNMQVVNCTTPANLFHLLRRQIIRPFRIPLIMITPKSLLRHPLCTSPLRDFTEGKRFSEVLDDGNANAKSVKKILFCSGKIYFDLLERQQKTGRNDIAIIRIEQIYPVPVDQLKKIIKKYKPAKQWVWVQEEPENMGVWPFLSRKLTWVPLEVISRKESNTPATGFIKQHNVVQKHIIEMAFH